MILIKRQLGLATWFNLWSMDRKFEAGIEDSSHWYVIKGRMGYSHIEIEKLTFHA